MDSWFGEGEGHGSLCEARKRLNMVWGGACKGMGVCVSSAAAGLSWVWRAGGPLWAQDIDTDPGDVTR